MSQQPFLRLLHGRISQLRTFTRTSPFCQRVPPKPPLKKPTLNPSPQHAAKTEAAKAASQRIPKTVPLQKFSPVVESTASKLLGGAERLTLYKAPPHNGFAILSYVSGGGIVAWGLMVANDTLRFSSGYLASMVVIAATLSALLGTALFMAPMKLIKSVSIVRTSEGAALLRFECRRRIPFRKPKAFEVRPEEVSTNKDVPMSLQTWHNVTYNQAEEWTDAEKPLFHPLLEPPTRWMSYVRRMFNRDGMVYVNIQGQGVWKMDLNECEILHNGAPLMKVARQDHTIQQSILQRLLKSPSAQRVKGLK